MRPRRSSLALAALALLGPLALAAPELNWAEVLGPAEARARPAPQAAVTWRTALGPAMREAQEQDRPLLVVLRCLPCKQCADFDKDVLEGGPTLDPLLKQVIPVRLTSMSEVDARILRFEDFQDLDLSWWAYLLSPTGQIYSVFGGKDEVSDSSRISVAALVKSLERVLAHHYDPRRGGWGLEGPAPELGEGEPLTPKDLPGYEAWYAGAHAEVRKQTCLHCHQVSDILRQPAIDAGRFDKSKDFYVWPFPENIGLVLDRDDGLLVKEVLAKSPAARAGLKPGDELGAAEGRRLFGQADLRGVLHRGPQGAGRITLSWRRGGAVTTKRLELAEGWRVTDLGWRKSVAEARIGGHHGFPWPLPVDAGQRKRLGIPEGQLAIKPFLGKGANPGPAVKAGLRANHVIIAVNGESPDLAGRAFNAWFRLKFEPGDEVTYTILEGRTRKELRFTVAESR